VLRAWTTLLVCLAVSAATPHAQEVSTEYRVKAGFLYHFVKYVEWPAGSQGPLTICVAGRNPLGTVLEETVKGESVGGRPLAVRVILEPEPGCDVVFVPSGSATSAYLRAAAGMPTLTVGETSAFADMGGMITFVVDRGKVRFLINREAAERAQLRLSSRLLRLSIDAGETR
jgi:hypothetical protein